MADSSSAKKEIKTVLAPNAPWPVVEPWEPKQKFKHERKALRNLPPPKSRSRIAHTNKKYDEWLAKQ